MARTIARWARLVPLLSLVALVGVAAPASAACHVASFVESNVEAGEADGAVTLTIYLVGRQPSCEGSVDWATVDGSAIAGQDYEAASGTATFTSGDDREETVTIALLDDSDAEGAEEFTVALSNPTGGISSATAAATVTIGDDDGGDDGGDDAPSGEAPDQGGTDDGGGATGLIITVLVGAAVGGGVAFAVARRRRA